MQSQKGCCLERGQMKAHKEGEEVKVSMSTNPPFIIEMINVSFVVVEVPLLLISLSALQAT